MAERQQTRRNGNRAEAAHCCGVAKEARAKHRHESAAEAHAGNRMHTIDLSELAIREGDHRAVHSVVVEQTHGHSADHASLRRRSDADHALTARVRGRDRIHSAELAVQTASVRHLNARAEDLHTRAAAIGPVFGWIV